MVELHLAKVVVEGSNPFARSIFLPCGGVAQLAEQLTLNQRVQGSSPCTSTILRFSFLGATDGSLQTKAVTANLPEAVSGEW